MNKFAPYTTPGGRVYRLYTHLADRPHLLIAGAPDHSAPRPLFAPLLRPVD